MIDNYRREINYLKISLTDKCNLRCVYCMPENVKYKDTKINSYLSFDDYKFIIKSMYDIGITKVKFIGGEPILYPNLDDIIEFTRKIGIKDVYMTTNALGLSNRIKDLKDKGLKGVNISLDSLKEFKYRSVTRGGDLKQVLLAIDKCLKFGLKVKINCVVIKDFNDDEILDFVSLTCKNDLEVRFIELMSIGEAKKIYARCYVDMIEVFSKIGNLYRVSVNGSSNVAQYYKYKNSVGKIGIITPFSYSFCDTCNRLILTSRGTMKSCFNSGKETDLKPFLGKELWFKSIVKDVIKSKPEKHKLNKDAVKDTDKYLY